MKTTTKAPTVRELLATWVANGEISPKQIARFQNKEYGNQPENANYLCVGDLSFKHNGRIPRAKDILKSLSTENGINWHLFETVNVARLPDGSSDSAYNGGHRSMMAAVCFGPDAEVPVTHSQFPDDQTVIQTFWKSNTETKNVNPECVAIAQIRAGDKSSKLAEIEKILLADGDTVIYENTDIFEPQQNQPNWSIKVKAMEDMCKDHKPYANDGIKLYKSVFRQIMTGSNTPFVIEGTVLKALTFILDTCNAHHFSQNYKGISNRTYFENWLVDSVKCKPALKLWHQKHAKANPLERLEKRHIGVAKGIWEEYCIFYTNTYNAKKDERPLQSVIGDIYSKLTPKVKEGS